MVGAIVVFVFVLKFNFHNLFLFSFRTCMFCCASFFSVRAVTKTDVGSNKPIEMSKTRHMTLVCKETCEHYFPADFIAVHFGAR